MVKKCLYCGKEIERILDKYNTKKYCNSDCMEKAKEQREKKKKSKNKCRRCGKPKEQSYLQYCKKCWEIRKVEYKKKEKKTRKKYAKEEWKNNKDNVKWMKRKYGYAKKAYMKKYRNDANFRLCVGLRSRFCQVMKKYTQEGKIKSSKKYGIDYKAIIEHLKPFPKDLRNYEIYHIKPLHTFNFVNKDGSTNLKEVRKAFAPKNHIILTKEEHKKIHKKE